MTFSAKPRGFDHNATYVAYPTAYIYATTGTVIFQLNNLH